MAEFLVSTVLEQLRSLAIDKLKAEMGRLVDVEEEVTKLQRIFLKIQDGQLADADHRQLLETEVYNWLWELQDVSYDIDDVLEGWIASIQKKPEAAGEDENNGPGTEKRVLSSSDLISCGCYRLAVERHKIAVKMEKLNLRLDMIAEDRKKYNFRQVGSNEPPPRAKTTSAIHIPEVKGRDKDKEKLVGLLLDESSSSSCSTPSLGVISLVGMGGLGKTTMAKLVYNERKVKNHFEERIWVHVGDPFKEIKVAKAILESITQFPSNLEELQPVTELINKSVAGKKFLLVLDDVWNEDSERWKQLKCSLMSGSPGSRILVTTRKENVASVMGSTESEMYKLGLLSADDAWAVFSEVAFFGWSNGETMGVKEIGEELVKKCQGLPLALKALGGHLRPYKSREKWLGVSKNQLWEIKKAKEDILPALWLSYYDLSPELKRCFSYCAVFPKGETISKFDLIAAWMAQGYIKERRGEDMEMVGEEYFQDLAARSFFQDFERDRANRTCVKMHDMVHDVAQFLSKNECCTLEVNGYKEPNDRPYSFQPRHSTLLVSSQSQSLSYFDSLEKLTSLFVKSRSHNFHIRPDIFSRLTPLRSLNLSCHGVEMIPSTIGKLIHLRWLCLSSNKLVELPEAICELYYLQTLDITYCNPLVKLPRGIGKLTNLRHLCNRYSISVLPKKVKDLVNLRTLVTFVVGDGGVEAASLGDLGNLKHLRGQVRIENLGEKLEVSEAKLTRLEEKTGITDLVIIFQEEEGKRKHEGEEKRKNHDRELLEALKPPSSLTNLSMSYYQGTPGFPIWVSSLISLRKLELSSCINCKQLPSLGRLPSLEELLFYRITAIERVGPELLGMETSDFDRVSPVVAFPKLSTLEFRSMWVWETWRTTNTEVEEVPIRTIIMPCLRSLRIRFCPRLVELPLYISQKVTTAFPDLQIRDCPRLKGKYPCVH